MQHALLESAFQLQKINQTFNLYFNFNIEKIFIFQFLQFVSKGPPLSNREFLLLIDSVVQN